jgi:hypothetical protein
MFDGVGRELEKEIHSFAGGGWEQKGMVGENSLMRPGTHGAVYLIQEPGALVVVFFC